MRALSRKQITHIRFALTYHASIYPDVASVVARQCGGSVPVIGVKFGCKPCGSNDELVTFWQQLIATNSNAVKLSQETWQAYKTHKKLTKPKLSLSPGSLLAYLIFKFTYKPPCCTCTKRANQMNQWGWWRCWKNRKTIFSWLTNAKL